MASPEIRSDSVRIVPSEDGRSVDFIQPDGTIVPGPTLEEARASTREGEAWLRARNEERQREARRNFDSRPFVTPVGNLT